MSEISELFANVGVDKHEKQHKHNENKTEIKHEKKAAKLETKENKELHKKQKEEIKKVHEKYTEKKHEEIKKHIEARNDLKKDVEHNSKNFDKYIGKSMGEMSIAMGFSAIGLERLIDRESGFNKNANSTTGAKGIMQLTGAPLQDMESKEIGAANYLHIIKKIPDTAINSIKNKWVKIAFERIKDGDTKVYNREIKEITSRAKNDPYCNFIVGCIHLAKLKEEADPNNISKKKQVIENLKKVENKGLKEINQLLIAKNKAPISNKDIDDIINKLHQNPEYYKNFVSYINYNGDNTKQAGIAHKYLYAVAIVKGKDQIA